MHAKSELAAAGETFGRGGRILEVGERIEFVALFGCAGRRFAARVFHFALAEAVDGVVCGYAVDPRAEVSLAGKLFKFLIAAQKSLLNDFLRVMRIARHAVGESIDVVAVTLDENAIGVAIAGEGALDSDGVREKVRAEATLDARSHLRH